MVDARLAAVVGDHVRGRAPKHERGPGKAAELGRGLASVVPGLRVGLLVAPLVLFVEHHQPKVPRRHEQR